MYLKAKQNQNISKIVEDIVDIETDTLETTYDMFEIIWPSLEKQLNKEKSLQELANLFHNVRPQQMKNWLENAVEKGKVENLSKPVRYIAKSSHNQNLPLLSLIEKNQVSKS